ncbi:2-methoxy-6-polyprenyl-1,4-benzoquinol methylase, mitochondrial [Lutzomyia longipalpis]|uniref:2-methoxy-6-polyprenyl-1,4-benzoquinol methylase, mitochondrial n=1 Tax=Lutzomyia longipalpis TaxID=7200 RepID=UPI0024834C27|nr:2-methoxy-6-polyprenyl-1,4-benzoquinol methylase, mitochondrial [Lutzomyia longipalpis]
MKHKTFQHVRQSSEVTARKTSPPDSRTCDCGNQSTTKIKEMISKIHFLAKNSHKSAVNLCVRHLRSQIQYIAHAKDPPDAGEKAENLTHFGFESIREDEKAGKVHKVFEDVAQSYDLMNDVLSMGIHRLWKDAFMEELGPTPGTKLLDMAGGTGDIAFRFLKYLANIKNPEKKESHLTIGDINEHMLNVGKGRAEKLGLTKAANCRVDWVCADAENLPFDSNTFTAYTIAFGIRNCTHIDKVLSEAHRVLAPGGRFLCLEFSHLPNETLQKIYDRYSFEMIPPLGQIFAGQWQHYQYLVESIRRFPRQENFTQMIRSAGFSHVTHRNLTFGISAIHSGFKFQ